MTTETGVLEKGAASELRERRWAVTSERGCEATRLDYAGASELVRRLKGEGLRGLCVVTETAAGRLPPAKTATTAAEPGAGNGTKPRAARRAPKK